MAKFSIPGMSCGHCRASIEKAVLEADEGAELTFDMEAREVAFDTVLEEDEIVEAVKAAGFEATPLG